MANSGKQISISSHPLFRWLSPNISFGLFACFSVFCIWAGLFLDQPFLFAAPFAVLLGLLIIADFKYVFYLLFLALPLSIEFEVTSSLATDLPTEPLMVLLMFIGILYLLIHPEKLPKNLGKDPLILLLFIHIFWIALCTIFSSFFLVSFKFLLAKSWYIVSFLALGLVFIKEEKDFRIPFWCMVIPLCFVVIQTVFRHALLDFEFHAANKTMTPFFRNHVNYAVMLAVVFPYLWLSKRWYKKGSLKRLGAGIAIFIFLLGITFAYTRAAYLSLLLIPPLYFVFVNRLTKWLAALSLLIVLLGVLYYSVDNRYLNLAPDFEKTIYHDDFDDHLAATFEGKDVSSMERVYRWVAAVRMSGDRWLTGFGPGNFYNYYRFYTVNNFETYVSDNKEKSGVHNYYLMTLVEQGFIGLAIFLLLSIAFLVIGENLLRSIKDPNDWNFVMAILLSQALLLFNLLLSDMIEVDKTGSIFFLNFALLISYTLKYSESNTT